MPELQTVPCFSETSHEEEEICSAPPSSSTEPESEQFTYSFEQTAIIFDWDDTLLCSSFLSQRNMRLDAPEPSEDILCQLRRLEQSVCGLLKLALRCGRVCVITNAETGWVQLSAKKWLPQVVPLLDEITILSARSTYEAQFPSSPCQWKTVAFRDQLSTLFPSELSKNVLSFGDSHVEREAVLTATKELNDVKCKSIKFITNPNTEQLVTQIELIYNSLHYLCSHAGDLDLMLTLSLFGNTPLGGESQDGEYVMESDFESHSMEENTFP